jgi:hypothetical protein
MPTSEFQTATCQHFQIAIKADKYNKNTAGRCPVTNDKLSAEYQSAPKHLNCSKHFWPSKASKNNNHNNMINYKQFQFNLHSACVRVH